MDARCPLCTAVFQTERTGVQFCPNCGQQVNVADVTGAAPPPPPPSGPGPGPQFFPPPGGAPPPFNPPPPPGPGGREPTPFERRDQLGFFAAFFATWKQVMFSPTKFFERANTSGGIGSAILYGFLINLIAQLVSLPFQLAQAGRTQKQDLSSIPPELRDQMEKMQELTETILQPKVFITIMIVGIILYPLALLIQAAMFHLFALLWGASKNGYWATFRTCAFAFSPMVFSISCLGILAFVYSLVLLIFGIWKMQETTPGRAVGAVLSIFVLVCCCSCCLTFLIASSAASAAGGIK